MSEIVSLFTVFSSHLSAATLRQFCEIVFAVLAMTGGVTMRNISRWTSKGGSYRTIQRFYNTLIPWEHFVGCSLEHISLILRVFIYLLAMKASWQNRGMTPTVYRVFSLQHTVKRYGVWRFLRCPSSVSTSAVPTQCLWNRSSGAKQQHPRK